MSDKCMTSALSRRGLFRAAGASAAVLAGAASAPRAASAQAAAGHMEVLSKLVGGKAPQSGRVKIRMPEIAENGNTVPITVSVDSPMTAQDHVKAVHVVTDGNPRPEIMSVRFTPAAGKAELSTRMRLAKSASVIAYAEMSDGSVWSASTQAKVTIGGCGG